MMNSHPKLSRGSSTKCVVCGAPGAFPFDGRFDGTSCDACHAMLTVRDDIFRRLHPEHEDVIRAIWHDMTDPAKVLDIGRRYVQIGYFESFEALQDDTAATGPDDRLRRAVNSTYASDRDDKSDEE